MIIAEKVLCKYSCAKLAEIGNLDMTTSLRDVYSCYS